MPAVSLSTALIHNPQTAQVEERSALDKRKGGGGGGSRGSSSSSGSHGSSSSSGGTRGGGSSSSSSGTKGGGSSTSSSGTKGGSSTKGGYSGPSTGSNHGGVISGNRGSIFGPSPRRPGYYGGPTYGYGYGYPYGYGHPYAGGPVPVFGYWPLYWDTDNDAGNANQGARPGGPVISMGIVQNGGNASNTEYVITGDTFSVDTVLPFVEGACGAFNVTAPANMSNNQTLATFRDDSFALTRFNNTPVAVNSPFENCLNLTIGSNLPVSAANANAAPLNAVLVALVVGFKLLF